jgi:Fe-S cluster assembly iron-binding protein IscA
MMVRVTTRALEMLAELRASANMDDPHIGLRLEAAASGGLGLLPDRERPGDQIVEYAGEKVLLVDDDLSEVLTGAQIDCKPVGEEMQLVIWRRNGAEPHGETNGASH